MLSNEKLKKAIVVRGDLADSRFLERVLAEYQIQTVFHLAAQTIVPIANNNPLSTFESNIAGTWNLLEACRHVKTVSAIVVASSDKAYGDVKELPYKETTSLDAIYPYDVSKACADMLSTSYAKSFDLPVAITRCGNFFGGGDLNWNRIIPGTIRSVIRGKTPVIRSDGKLIRDYIYVEDAVSAYMSLAESLTSTQELKGEAFNFSNEAPKTVLELTEIILEKLGSNISPVVQGINNGEIHSQFLDSTKARTVLGWSPKFGLNDGLTKTIKWYKTYLGEI